MSFFRNMNLARGIILLAVLGSLFLAWRNQQDRDKLAFLQQSLRTTVPETVESIQELSQHYSKLIRAQSEDGLARESTPQSYIASVKDLKGAELGLIVPTESDSPYDDGIEDLRVGVKPFDKDAAFRREQIAYFMWELEKGSRRLKVTDIDLQLANRRGLKNHDIPEDKWTYRIETTIRQEEAE